MKATLALCVTLVALYHAEGATTGTACSSSYTCGSASCCRDSNGKVISTAEGNHHGGFGELVHHRSGTCTTQKAQKGEMCDTSCQCDTGLSCYRPMSGMCCPASTCVDEAYAKQQHAYWTNCFSDPNCAIPV